LHVKYACRCLIDTGNEQDNFANDKVLEWHEAASLETGGKATSRFEDTGETVAESCVVCSPLSDYCMDCSRKASVQFEFSSVLHDELIETKKFPITLRFIHMHNNNYDLIIGQNTIKQQPCLMALLAERFYKESLLMGVVRSHEPAYSIPMRTATRRSPSQIARVPVFAECRFGFRGVQPIRGV
jgi:hypothetical protein